jgi:hypothetical protein
LVLAVCASGAGAVRLGLRAPATGAAERTYRAALALLLGLGLVSAASGAALLLARSRGPASDLLLLLLAVPLLLWKQTRAPAPAALPAERPPWPLVAVCAAGLAVFALIFLEHSVRYPDGAWDARAIWNLRARALARAGSDLALVFPPGEQVPHPDYPLLLPGLIAHAWSALGAESAWAPPLCAALFCAALLALLPAALATTSGPLAGAFGLLLLLGTPTVLTRAISQYADLPLAAFLLAAAALAARALSGADEGRPRLLLIAGLASSLGAWTKNEGLVSLLLLAALLAWAALRAPDAGRFRDVAAFLLGALPVLLLLGWFKLRWAPVNDLVAASSAAGLRARLLDPSRAAVIAWAYLRQLWRFEDWGVALPLVALSWPALKWMGRKEAPRPAQTLLARYALLLPLAYAGIYLATPSELHGHLDSSLDRLLLHGWPVALLSSLHSTSSCGRIDELGSANDGSPGPGPVTRGPDTSSPSLP